MLLCVVMHKCLPLLEYSEKWLALSLVLLSLVAEDVEHAKPVKIN
jgi:hypothetical protein